MTEVVRRGGQVVRGFGLGAEVATASVHDAVLAYRAAWDPYVVGALRSASTVADSFDTVAKNPPSGFTTEQLTAMAVNYRNLVKLLLEEWNQFAGLSPQKWTDQSSFILKAWADVVMRTSRLVADLKASGLASGVSWPPPPTEDVQRKVYLDLSTAAVDLTPFNILKLAADGSLEAVTRAVTAVAGGAGKAAGSAVGEFIRQVPWYGWTAVVVVGGAVIAVAVAPALAPLRAIAPRRRAA